MSELEAEYLLPPARPPEGGEWEPVPYRAATWPTPGPQRPLFFRVGGHTFNLAHIAHVQWYRPGECEDWEIQVMLACGTYWFLNGEEAARFRALWAAWAGEMH